MIMKRTKKFFLTPNENEKELYLHQTYPPNETNLSKYWTQVTLGCRHRFWRELHEWLWYTTKVLGKHRTFWTMIKKGKDGSVISYTQRTPRAILNKNKKTRLHLLCPCRSMFLWGLLQDQDQDQEGKSHYHNWYNVVGNSLQHCQESVNFQ